MDDKRFDSFVKALAGRRDRRSVLKGVLGLGGAAMGSLALKGGADAARRGYSGPHWPWPTEIVPGPCEPFCSVGMCGVPNGCGGMCSCSGANVCIQGACAPQCVAGHCDACFSDGGHQGCFRMTIMTCSDDTDCQAQFGAGLCRTTQSGQDYCYVPMSPA